MVTSGLLQVAEEREASSSLSSELSKARAALQKAQTEVARQRWGPDDNSILTGCHDIKALLRGSAACFSCKLPCLCNQLWHLQVM